MIEDTSFNSDHPYFDILKYMGEKDQDNLFSMTDESKIELDRLLSLVKKL